MDEDKVSNDEGNTKLITSESDDDDNLRRSKPEIKHTESSNENFNFSHKNDYLESDFSFTNQHLKSVKEKAIFSKLRDKYSFYPNNEAITQDFVTKNSINLNTLKNTVISGVPIENLRAKPKSSEIKRIEPKLITKNIMSKTGVNFNSAMNNTIKKRIHATSIMNANSKLPPLIKNLKTLNHLKKSVPVITKSKINMLKELENVYILIILGENSA